MKPLKILQRYYAGNLRCYSVLFEHSKAVAEKAVETAKRLKRGAPDLKFIEEAAILHDIGIFLTNAPEIYCCGEKPYVCHGYLGREILEKEGLPRHALVCERHLGAGITKEDIEKQGLPLPKRNMNPVSLEEQIICFADKFFSKGRLSRRNSVDDIKKTLARFGQEKVNKFEKWLKIF